MPVNVIELGSYVQLLVLVVSLAVKGFALVSALLFPAQAYAAADKATKLAWGIGLGLGFAVQVLLISSPVHLIHIGFTIAALVYLADVRPALARVTPRR